MNQKKNVGKTDQLIRVILALVLVVIATLFSIWWLLIPALVSGLTAYFGFCGLYRLIGINTCKIKQ